MDLGKQVLEAGLPDGNRILFRPFAEGDSEMVRDVYIHGHYDLLDLQPGEVVFDVGAHIGSFALKAARLVGEEGTVVAIEPECSNYEILRENAGRLGNIIPLPLALSDFQGRGRLFIAPGTIAHSISFAKSSTWQEVEVETIDGLIERTGLRPDAVKIDAEGAALNILSAAKDISIRRVAVAAYHYPMEDAEVRSKLRGMGLLTDVRRVRASIYRSPFTPYVPIVLGMR